MSKVSDTITRAMAVIAIVGVILSMAAPAMVGGAAAATQSDITGELTREDVDNDGQTERVVKITNNATTNVSIAPAVAGGTPDDVTITQDGSDIHGTQVVAIIESSSGAKVTKLDAGQTITVTIAEQSGDYYLNQAPSTPLIGGFDTADSGDSISVNADIDGDSDGTVSGYDGENVSLSVALDNNAPEFGDKSEYHVLTGQDVTVDKSFLGVSDPDGQDSNVSIKLDVGNDDADATEYQGAHTFQFENATELEVEVIATDGSGATTTKVVELDANDGDNAPNADVALSGGSTEVGDVVDFSAGESSDPDAGDTLSYRWDIDADGQYDDATGADISTQFDVTGTQDVSVEVEDERGNTDTATVTVDITEDTAPTGVGDVEDTDDAVDWAQNNPVIVGVGGFILFVILVRLFAPRAE